MHHSIHFDTNKDNITAVQAAISKLFGEAPAGNEDDAPSAGDKACDPNTLDANGLPWDKRIHSDTPTMTDKNVWRKRRGVQPTTVKEVTAELLARIAGGAQAPAAPAAPQASAAPQAPAAPAAPQAPKPPAAPAAPPAPPAPPVNTAFSDLVAFIDTHMAIPANAANDKALIDDAWLKSTMEYYGVKDGAVANLAGASQEQIREIHDGMRVALGYTA